MNVRSTIREDKDEQTPWSNSASMKRFALKVPARLGPEYMSLALSVPFIEVVGGWPALGFIDK